MLKIAILGATSYIAKDLILSFSEKHEYDLSLFSRKSQVVSKWLECKNIFRQYLVKSYEEFNLCLEFDVIINFVGAGDPARVAKIGSSILDVTYQYDDMVVNYLKVHPECKYVFLSSGAVYNSNFNEPVNENSKSIIPINGIKPKDWYGISKLYAECRHRALESFCIIDVRVFSYFSHNIDILASFFMADIVRAILNKNILCVSPDDMVRDYIGPDDFFQLIEKIIIAKPSNEGVDCYTGNPVSKVDMLVGIQDKFGLNYEFNDSVDAVSPTGLKSIYCSNNKNAHKGAILEIIV